MSDQDPKREREWGKALAAARARTRSWREGVAECERARDLAVEVLRDCSERMGEMLERGEIGSRGDAQGQRYPQLRVVYWGEIESGSMSLACVEVDYGFGDKARVGVWGRLRAVWDCSGLSGPRERFGAWVAGWGLGSSIQSERAWLAVKACLRSMSMDLDLDLKFGSSPGRETGAWADWLSNEGSDTQPLAPLGLEEGTELPGEQEWEDLGRRAAGILDSFNTERRAGPADGKGDAGSSVGQ